MKTALTPAFKNVPRRGGSRPDAEDARTVASAEAATLAPAPEPAQSGRPSEPTQSEPASAQRSDADILKEIARQIREGVSFARGSRDAGPDRAGSTGLPTGGENRQAADSADTRFGPRPLSTLDPDHFAKLAHELKTPLTAIAAAAEVMRDERLGEMGNERYLSYAADIHESATHALDVITALLAETAQPDAAHARAVALDLNALVRRTVSSVQALAESRGLTLAFDAEDSRPHVIANPTAMRQILLNLLTNAIKFTPRGGDVRVVTGYIDDGRVFLVVRDTGCGMNGDVSAAPEVVAEDVSPPWTRGNGIGLPLVQRLVREMGADIEIDSASGKGTVVLIAFGHGARTSA